MDEKTILDEAQRLRDEASIFASGRLSRGSLRIQDGSFATESEWCNRRANQAARILRINKRLNAR